MGEFHGRGNTDIWYLPRSACYKDCTIEVKLAVSTAVESRVGVTEALGDLIWACERPVDMRDRLLSTRRGVSYTGQDDVIVVSGCAAGANEIEVDDER